MYEQGRLFGASLEKTCQIFSPRVIRLQPPQKQLRCLTEAQRPLAKVILAIPIVSQKNPSEPDHSLLERTRSVLSNRAKTWDGKAPAKR